MKALAVRESDEFEYLLRFLPEGWERKAKELGALRRCRGVADAQRLLRVLLIHLAEGCSLRETAVLARAGGWAHLSDVAILERLRQAGEWFRWMNMELMRLWVPRRPELVYGGRWRVRLVDGTAVEEPGPTGSSWRLHYAVNLSSLACDQLLIAPPGGAGESFRLYRIQPGDLLMGERAYGVPPGIAHVLKGQGHVLVRFALSNLPLEDARGRGFDLLGHLRQLRGAALGDWPVALPVKEGALAGRVCAIKKSQAAAERARKQVLRQGQKQGLRPRPETLEAAGYTFLFTTLPQSALSAENTLEGYRGRWQIELVFKRLKSIIGLGHLHKTDPQSAVSWLHGKLFVAFLLETCLRYAESFFPWGYPLRPPASAQPLPVA